MNNQNIIIDLDKLMVFYGKSTCKMFVNCAKSELTVILLQIIEANLK